MSYFYTHMYIYKFVHVHINLIKSGTIHVHVYGTVQQLIELLHVHVCVLIIYMCTFTNNYTILVYTCT